MKLAPLLLALALAASLSAQTFTDPANLRGERVSPSNGRELPVDKSEAQGGHGLQQLLRRLNTRASILNIVAHPDDEDGGMLTLYSRGLGARVADLALTRGEGGQNAMTADFEDALGLIRTQELLSSDRYPGITQFFGTEVDFGFSKTKEESFAKWTHQRVLYDAVRAIRLFRPLVITATFIGGVTDGHGQHQVSGEIAQEAFVAAADPKVFPELTAEGILPWQALKVYARVPRGAVTGKGLFDYATNQYTPARFTNYVTGEVSTTIPSVDVVIHEGQTDPLLTYASACDTSALSTGASNNSVLTTEAQRNTAVISTEAPNNSVLSTEPRASAASRGGSGETCSSTAQLSYVQFARIGLGLQKTQITGNMRTPPGGPFDVSYHLYGSALCTLSTQGNPVILSGAKDPCISPAAAHSSASSNHDPEHATFFDGIDTTLESIATLSPQAPNTLKTSLHSIASNIAAAQQAFNPSHPEVCAPPLADALKSMDSLIKSIEPINDMPAEQKQSLLHELRIKRVQLNDALSLSLGLHLAAAAPAQNIVTGSTAEATIDLTESSSAPVLYKNLSSRNSLGAGLEEARAPSAPALSSAHPVNTLCGLSPDLTTKSTRPYFSRTNIEQPVYNLSNPELRNAPATPPAFSCFVQLIYNNVPLTLGAIALHDSQPVSIVPPISIASSPAATVFPLGRSEAQSQTELTATLRTLGKISANINVGSPKNWSIQAKAATAPSSTTDHPIDFYVRPTAPFTEPQLFHVTAETPDHHVYTESFRPAGYPGLISTNFYTPATTRIVPVDLKLPTKTRIAYLPGTGDSDPEALASIGISPTILTVADLTPANLAQYDTVILGVRTYSAHPDLHGAPTQALLDYARNGGNVLVQFQTAEFTAADAPYPLTLGYDAEKIVDETDPVVLLEPSSPLLTTPNKITPADFNNWIEERGHGFLQTWDSHYTPLLETHDPGGPETAPELPQRGGLLTTSLGKGHWAYCAFALYRQLPEAVPGAYRLFVNLLSPHPAP
jgi:LmbE family N-acetylglucosaminyl deacetylase